MTAEVLTAAHLSAGLQDLMRPRHLWRVCVNRATHLKKATAPQEKKILLGKNFNWRQKFENQENWLKLFILISIFLFYVFVCYCSESFESRSWKKKILVAWLTWFFQGLKPRLLRMMRLRAAQPQGLSSSVLRSAFLVYTLSQRTQSLPLA